MKNVTEKDLAGTSKNIERDIGKTFIHEAIHTQPAEGVMKSGSFNMKSFNDAHQDEYKAKASELYNVPGVSGP